MKGLGSHTEDLQLVLEKSFGKNGEIKHDLAAYILGGLLISSHFDPIAKLSG